MSEQEKIGTRIRILRVKNGMSQSDLARFVGCHYQAVNDWETGRFFPSVKAVLKICEAFDTDPNTILGWNDSIDLSAAWKYPRVHR